MINKQRIQLKVFLSGFNERFDALDIFLIEFNSKLDRIWRLVVLFVQVKITI